MANEVCRHRIIAECDAAWHKRWTCQRCGACWRCGRLAGATATEKIRLGSQDDGAVWTLKDMAAACVRGGYRAWPMIADPLPPRCQVIVQMRLGSDGKPVAKLCRKSAYMATKSDVLLQIDYWCRGCWGIYGEMLAIEKAKAEARL